HWTKAEFLQCGLTIDRENIQHQTSRRWLGIFEESQAIFWSDAQRVGNVDNVEGGQLTQAELGAGAVTNGAIATAIAQGCDRGIRASAGGAGKGTAHDLLGLGVEDSKT